MASRSNNHNGNNNGNDGSDAYAKLITKAVRYSRLTRKDRRLMLDTLALLDPPGEEVEHHETTIPPRAFRNALRRPIGSRRAPITVWIDGVRIPILLNPQGKADPERERWLWAYTRDLVRGARSGR